jgi:hypothetical protein
MTDTEDALVKACQVWASVATGMRTEELKALARGLESGDPALLRGKTALPYPLRDGDECEGACLVCYGAWRTGAAETVGEVNDHFGTVARALGPVETHLLTGQWDSGELTNEIALDWIRAELARRAAA